MFGFGLVRKAFSALADAVNGWATTINEINARTREQMLLDDHSHEQPVNRLLITATPAAPPEDAEPAANGRKKGSR